MTTPATSNFTLQDDQPPVTSHGPVNLVLLLLPSAMSSTSPRDLMSYNDYLTMLSVFNCVLKPVIIAVGVPTNVISCVVFWRQGLRSRMNVCLLALVLVDLCFLLVAMAFMVCFFLELIDPVRFDGLYISLQGHIVGVNHGFRIASGCITMVIAVERCLCVLFPLKAASLISSRGMAVIMVGIVCLTQVGYFSMPATYVVRWTNSTPRYVLTKSSDLFMQNQKFFTVLEKIIMMNVVPITTFIITCLTTGLTMVKLTAAITWRGKMSSTSEQGQDRHTAVSKMLVVVCGVYILSSIPCVMVYVSTLVTEEFTLRDRGR
ncbi:uncharacterized protein LOC112557110 [Pomacea canaliculata]|uniref:uncharacterized protein LOC112557110 n=1 Tax=Pomacea canaliculata TaxID=400727 RepID=UPI000D72ECC6|nr:uncharacterized protein LOC112557110 [Pomacea canaliculata]